MTGFSFTMLDIAIGIVFVFVLVSLIASTINEIILSFLNMRGKELLAGLKTLLDDDDASGLVNKIYNHGQIFGLFKGQFDPQKPGNLPSYIPSQNFVMALLDILPSAAHLPQPPPPQQTALAVAAAAGAAPGALQPGTQPPAAPQTASAGTATAGVTAPAPQPTTAPPVAQQTAPSSGSTAATPPAPPEALAAVQQDATALLANLRAAAQKLAADPKTEKVGKPLMSMLDAAEGDVAKLKKSVEDWFNGAMDRVSGWYKYRTQWMLFSIGLVLAALLNADTIRIVKQLSTDSTLRQSIVAAASNVKPPAAGPGATLQDQINLASTQISGLTSLGIPLGWDRAPDFPIQTAAALGSWLNMLLGWLLTAIAVSLGAPFWFDILNKIMVIRSTIKPGEKAQAEPSK
jgi:hypothetical protein